MGQFRWEQRLGAPVEPDAGRIDIGRGKKGTGRNFEPFFGFILQLHEKGELAIIVIAGLRHQPCGNFELECNYDALGRAGQKREFNENGRRDGVGEIRDEHPIGPIAAVTLQEFQSVGMEECECFWVCKTFV